jgi:MFS transporter, PAT family, solute carrier family 33 (acetyl-CoA transportor), member 1
MKELISVLLICKIGYIVSDKVAGLKLLEAGFKKEQLAITALIDFPFQLVFGYYAAKWSSGARPLRPWIIGLIGKVFLAALSMLIIAACPKDGITSAYFAMVVLSGICSSLMGNIMFVGISSFFSKVSDPTIGMTI